jgi:EmrB/QacA subfamily drug resistance transporter
VRLALRQKTSPTVILGIICIGIFIAAADQTVIYGALPDMMPDLHLTAFQLDRAAWIVVGYLLGYAFAMPLMGRVSDIHGHSRIYILSAFMFMVGSIFVAMASNIQWMISARVFQAIGGGAMVPIAMAIVGDICPEKSRPIALGVIGGAVEAGAALGPTYGGLFGDFLDWRWIFWINLPICLVVIFLVSFLSSPSPKAKGSIDYIGSVLLGAGLTFLSLAVYQVWGSPGSLADTISFLSAAMLFLGLFIFRQVRASEPLLQLSMFRKMTFSGACLTNLFVGGALIIALVNVPLMSDTILGSSALEGGLRLLRLTIMISVGAIAGGYLCRRFGYYLPTITGLILSGIGFFLMSRWSLDIRDPAMTLHLAVCGLGFGLVIAPLATGVIDSVRDDQRGIGSSMALMMRMIGMILGLAALTSWGMGNFHRMTTGMSLQEVMALPEGLVASLLSMFHNFFTASIGICLVAILPALLLGRKRKLSPNSRNNDRLV